jgi:hypothetical protein
VTHLALPYSNLTGLLPHELGGLVELTVLDLSDNQLAGKIPPEIGNLAALQHIYLYRNALTGPIPSTLGSLQNLRKLYLSSNSLDNEIPAELGLLSSLEYLDLAYNHLSGPIPASLGDLANLQSLSLSVNRLAGRVPSTLLDLTLLNHVRISFNGLWTDDDAVRAMLDTLNPNWYTSQTIPPTDVRFGPAQGDSLEVAWNRISYMTNDGGYQVYLSALPALFADGFETGDQTAWGGLPPGALTTTSKYWAHLVTQSPAAPEGLLVLVRSFTLPHSSNANTVISEWINAREVEPPVYSCGSPVNLLVNGCLDFSVSGLVADSGTLRYDDSTGADSAGCGFFSGPGGIGTHFLAHSCVQQGVHGGASYSFGIAIRGSWAQPNAPTCVISAETHDTPDCSGNPMTTVDRLVTLYGSGWTHATPTSVVAEPSAVAVNLALRCSAVNDLYTSGWIDDVYLLPQTKDRTR